jgi:hypothetical protein
MENFDRRNMKNMRGRAEIAPHHFLFLMCLMFLLSESVSCL